MVGKSYIIAGSPIFHSYSPHLFRLIHSFNNQRFESTISENDYFFLETQKLNANSFEKSDDMDRFSQDLTWHDFNLNDKFGIDYFAEFRKNLDEEILSYVNLTSPLKHTTSSLKFENLDDSLSYESVNCLAICENNTYSISTDGLAVVWLALLAGLEIEKSVLSIVGGGGTARSAANAWISFGGKVNQISGNRRISIPEESKTDEPSDFMLLIDSCEDFSSLKSDAVILQAKYNSTQEVPNHLTNLGGTHLLVAQHLLCWYLLWNDNPNFKIPTFSDLLANLEEFISDKN
tara:strand:- start:830 stop:1699 length:870 start_codon:yes stop_codon:yes gene_type:complete